MAEQVINVRDLETREWTEEMYVFCDDMFSDLVGIFGEDNVRVISAEEHERHCLRRRQDREVASCRETDQQKITEPPNVNPTSAESKAEPAQKVAPRAAAHTAARNAASTAASNTSHMEREGPLTTEELRAKRIQYFERQKWTRRLRPRK